MVAPGRPRGCPQSMRPGGQTTRRQEGASWTRAVSQLVPVSTAGPAAEGGRAPMASRGSTSIEGRDVELQTRISPPRHSLALSRAGRTSRCRVGTFLDRERPPSAAGPAAQLHQLYTHAQAHTRTREHPSCSASMASASQAGWLWTQESERKHRVNQHPSFLGFGNSDFIQ